MSDKIRAHYGNRYVVQRPLGASLEARSRSICSRGAAPARSRNLCMRGCPFGGYFSSELVHAPVGGEDGQPDPAPGLRRAFDHVRRAQGPRDRRARDRREHSRGHRVSRPHHLRERVGAQLDPDPAQLDLVAIPAWARQRQRPARQIRRPSTTTAPAASGTIDGFEDQYFYGRRPYGMHPRELPQPREAGDGLRRRLHDVHRRVARARRVRRIASAARTRTRRPGRGRGGSTCTCRARRSRRSRTTSACTRPEGPVGHPAARHVGGLRRERRADDPRLAHRRPKEMLEVAGCRDVETRQQQLESGPRHPRDGRLPHGTRSEDLAAQRVEPVARAARTSSSPTARA